MLNYRICIQYSNDIPTVISQSGGIMKDAFRIISNFHFTSFSREAKLLYFFIPIIQNTLRLTSAKKLECGIFNVSN